MPAQKSRQRQQLLLFARNFFKHPKMLGSLIPSSRFLVDEMLSEVNWETARVIVEYGPGVGTFTHEILKRMGPEGTVVAIEMNDDFVRFLGEGGSDPRLHVVHGSAADVGTILQRIGKGKADYIISGIPFSTMPPQVADGIVRATRDALTPGGAFLVYQFSRDVLPYLKRTFGRIRQGFNPLNIPPARLYYCNP
ncbi:MAG TPA: rRNA adenine N-6-methyltransferase family protein [Longimicrobium sp.]